ncbi:alpha carbonic anhydrase 4 [Amborella trichopoda]|nr:alpha carbonic anhydrase 4 [Amborella trichopoda]|eukprot:XP_011622195.1 alpha carbonic anhydrase 4 [Amborella trichopoda]
MKNENKRIVECDIGFDYSEGSGKGPEDWGKLYPEWASCSYGRTQSPIDLATQMPIPVYGSLGLQYYKPYPAVLQNKCHDIAIAWNGPTWDGRAGGILLDNKCYQLSGCHWHSPSEHTFDGHRSPLELHMVHKSSDNQRIVVVGVTYEIGEPDIVLERLMEYIKSLGLDKCVGVGELNPRDVLFGQFLEYRPAYYRYNGSLTTPPCTENVDWIVLKKKKSVSWQQLVALREAVGCGYQSNARPTQPINDRPVWFYGPFRSAISY